MNGLPTVEIKQTVIVSQGRTQITIGPNEITKDAAAGNISFKQGPQKTTLLP